MSDRNSQWLQKKIGLQALALALVLLPPVGMIFALAAGSQAVIWILLALVVAGNLVGLWVS